MAKRRKPDLSVTKLRSAITNGKFLLLGTDHRSAWMRRLRDLVANHISDLGGEDQISHSEHLLINRAAMLALQLEMMERRFADTDGVAGSNDLQMYQRAINTLRRTLESLGLKRRPKDVPSIEQYIASKTKQAAAFEDVEEAR